PVEAAYGLAQAGWHQLFSRSTVFVLGKGSQSYPRDSIELKFGDLSPEAQAARLLHCRHLGIISVRRLAEGAGLPVERTDLLMCRGLSTLIARGYPAEELCETYRVTPEQLSRASIVPVFSSIFEPLCA